MDERLADLLARRAELNDDELAELAAGLREHYKQVKDDESLTVAERLEQAREVVATIKEVEGIVAEHAAKREQDEAALAALDAELDTPDTTTDETGDEPPADEPAETPKADAKQEQELVTASAPKRPALSGMSARRPAKAEPADEQPTGDRIRQYVVAAGDVRGFSTGQELTDWSQIGKALAARVQAGGSGPLPVVSFRREYPEGHRLLASESPEVTAGKIDGAVQQSLTAAGGLCTPLPVDYTIPEVGQLGRPFRDSLPSFQAERGGIQTVVPPALGLGESGIGFWTLANDVNPGDASVPSGERLASKPVVEFDCGASVTSYIYAVTARARYNNIRARFNPEVVASNARALQVAYDRLAELHLMTIARDQYAVAVSVPQLLGASRDFLAELDVLVTRMRARRRMTDAQRIHMWVPDWVSDMIRSDFVRQMPAGDLDKLMALADANLNAWLAVRGVNVTWLMEDLNGYASGGINVAQTAGARLGWPDTVSYLLAYEGDLLFLDGGELDLGTVRDSSLNSINKYETFYEGFEGLHFRGVEKPMYVTATLNPTGAAAGLVNTQGAALTTGANL